MGGTANQGQSFGLDLRVVAEAGEPMHGGVAAEPGELALGVVAMALLSGGDGGFAGEVAVEDSHCLGVAERGKRAASFTEAVAQHLRLGNEAEGEHGGGAAVDAGVQGFAFGSEVELEDAVAFERVAAGLPLGGLGLAGGEGDFNAADELGGVVGVDCRSGARIEALEDAVEIAGFCGEIAEAFAEGFVAGRGRGEAFEEGAEIEAGASGDDGDVATVADLGDGGAGGAGVVAGGAGFAGPLEIEAVVQDAGALGGGGFGGADLHEAIDGDRVAAYDLTV